MCLQTLAPIYAQLAKRFSGIESIVIAKFDGTENEHPDLDIQGFPSLMLFPAKGGAGTRLRSCTFGPGSGWGCMLCVPCCHSCPQKLFLSQSPAHWCLVWMHSA